MLPYPVAKRLLLFLRTMTDVTDNLEALTHLLYGREDLRINPSLVRLFEGSISSAAIVSLFIRLSTDPDLTDGYFEATPAIIEAATGLQKSAQEGALKYLASRSYIKPYPDLPMYRLDLPKLLSALIANAPKPAKIVEESDTPLIDLAEREATKKGSPRQQIFKAIMRACNIPSELLSDRQSTLIGAEASKFLRMYITAPEDGKPKPIEKVCMAIESFTIYYKEIVHHGKVVQSPSVATMSRYWKDYIDWIREKNNGNLPRRARIE